MAIDVNKIKLKGVRLGYPHLFKAHAMDEGDTPKYSLCAILDKKKHAKEIKMLGLAVEQVAKEKWKTKIPGTLKRPIRDGEEREDKDGFDDTVVFFNASSDKRPPVVNRDLSPITAEDDIVYPGCYVNITVRLWAQDNQYGKRVNVALRAVQFAKDGEAFGNSAPVNADEEFDEEEEPEDDEEEEEEEETPAERKKRLLKEKQKREKKRKSSDDDVL